MRCILQVDFPYAGPWGKEMSEAMEGLARSIAEEPGLIWKIWTENESSGTAGGVYLFADAPSAEAYLAMHTARLKGFGIPHVNAKLFAVNEALTRIDQGPV
ncbi:monooxygenase [Achromobacter denitrificans]